MDVMVILIFFSLIVAAGFLAAFVVSLKNGQFDDLQTPSIRILFDDTENNNRK